jgi:hypothetical protein
MHATPCSNANCLGVLREHEIGRFDKCVECRERERKYEDEQKLINSINSANRRIRP